MDTKVDQQVVLVTGSSTGIGRATAVAFGAEGAPITYHTNRDGAEQTAAHVEEAGGEPFITRFDLTDSDGIADFSVTVFKPYAPLDE